MRELFFSQCMISVKYAFHMAQYFLFYGLVIRRKTTRNICPERITCEGAYAPIILRELMFEFSISLCLGLNAIPLDRNLNRSDSSASYRIRSS